MNPISGEEEMNAAVSSFFDGWHDGLRVPTGDHCPRCGGVLDTYTLSWNGSAETRRVCPHCSDSSTDDDALLRRKA